MKNLFLTLAGFVLAATLFGQAPQRMNYQAVLRDANGVPQANTAGTLGLEVRQNTSTGLVVYSEVHNITTTTIGLAQVALGGGTVITGNFANIDWSAGPYFVKTSLNGTAMGTAELLSVPYALYAENGGTPGPAGPTGAQGPAGTPGAIGAQGPAGPAGAQGVPGSTGADGTGVTILGSFTNINQLPATGGVGDAWLVNGDLFVWSSNTNSWQNVGSIQGPAGPAGATGATGPQGAVGPQGNNGAIGATGPQGTPGTPGATGATGPQGPIGLTGPQGTPGTPGTNGAVGATGPQGNTGAQGPQGTPGTDGATGATGPQGTTGLPGTPGTNGTDGDDGLDGKTVLNGAINPAPGTGANGDFYINTATNFLYGPKTAGAWGAGVSLVGPTGPSGGGSGWALLGNTGTTPTTNFVGTTDI